MKQITLTLPDEVFNELRITSLHRQQEIEKTILAILKQYYETRGH